MKPLFAFLIAAFLHTSLAAAQPNIVFIMADDRGYGDVQALNPKSKIPTPNLNRLAKQGMTFTDAHSPSGVCTPTRYGVITGRYCWRSRLKRGVLGGYSAPLIEKNRPTVGSVLQKAGYHTAAIGKWHLGMNMTRREGGKPAKDRWDGDGNVDYTKPIADTAIITEQDASFGAIRTEVMFARCYAHLGHIFPDGSAPTGPRYFINSASLSFKADEG